LQFACSAITSTKRRDRLLPACRRPKSGAVRKKGRSAESAL